MYARVGWYAVRVCVRVGGFLFRLLLLVVVVLPLLSSVFKNVETKTILIESQAVPHGINEHSNDCKCMHGYE